MFAQNKKKKTNPFFKSVIALLTGTTIAQAIPIAVSPILSRIYTPEDFGLLALYLSVTSILGVAITARYELAIMLPEKDDDAINIMLVSVIISFIISVLVLIVILLWGRQIAVLLGNNGIYPWLYFVPLTLILTGLYQSFNYWSNRKKRYGRLATNRVAQSTSTAGFNLIAGKYKDGAFGLIMGNILAQAIVTFRLIYQGFKVDKFTLKNVSINRMKFLAKRYDQFPKVSMWSALLNSGSSNLPIFLLSAFFHSTVVGWYSMAHRVLRMPMSVLGNAVGQVFFQTTSNLRNTSPEKLKNITFRAYTWLLLIGLIPMSLIFGYGDILFAFIFGEEWEVAGTYARILSIWLLLVFVSSPLSMLFTVMEKEGILFIFNISIFITRVLSLLIGSLIFKDVVIALTLFSITGALFWFWHCLYILKLVKIPYKKTFSYTVILVTTIMGASLLMRIIIIGSI